MKNKDANSDKHPLDKLLDTRNLDRKELATLSGVSYDSLTSYVLGRRNITLKNAIKVCRVLNCSLKELADVLGYDVSGVPEEPKIKF